MTADEAEGLIQVLLRQHSTKIECWVTWQDDSTSQRGLQSSSMHRAKREVTSSLAGQGFGPVDRWTATHADGHEIIRHFRLLGREEKDRLRLPLVR